MRWIRCDNGVIGEWEIVVDGERHSGRCTMAAIPEKEIEGILLAEARKSIERQK